MTDTFSLNESLAHPRPSIHTHTHIRPWQLAHNHSNENKTRTCIAENQFFITQTRVFTRRLNLTRVQMKRAAFAPASRAHGGRWWIGASVARARYFSQLRAVIRPSYLSGAINNPFASVWLVAYKTSSFVRRGLSFFSLPPRPIFLVFSGGKVHSYTCERWRWCGGSVGSRVLLEDITYLPEGY